MEKLRTNTQRRNYVRKTKTVFVVLANYGEGFEEIEERDTISEVKQLVKDYRENASMFRYMFKKKRIKLV